MKKKMEWWRKSNAVKLFQGKSDGQKFTCIFAQDTPEGLEYAIIECSDGDYLDYVLGGVTLLNGVVTIVQRDAG